MKLKNRIKNPRAERGQNPLTLAKNYFLLTQEKG